jgi:rod shape-determining protein MreC
MDSLLNRFRSITVLLVVVVAQLILLAYSVKNPEGVRVIRLWAVTVVTPIAQIAETTRSTVWGVFHNYFDLRDARQQNHVIQAQRDQLKLENLYLKSELNTADRVKALAAFQKVSPSRYVAARIILTATTSASRIVILDRGSNSEVEKGMAVITPDGIVGKIIDAFPTASQALLVTDPEFAAGVVSQKNHVKGILHGAGSGKCRIDNVQTEEKVDEGEMFFTSGDDRIFPRGLPVGKADVVREGTQYKEILLYPSGLQAGPEEVLIVLAGVHAPIPAYEAPPPEQKVYLGPPVPQTKAEATTAALTTDADRLREHYEKLGKFENHKFGEGGVPNFNAAIPANAEPPVAAGTTTAPKTNAGTNSPPAVVKKPAAAGTATAPKTSAGTNSPPAAAEGSQASVPQNP